MLGPSGPSPTGSGATGAFGPSLGGLAQQVAGSVVQLFFGGLVSFVSRLDTNTIGRLWQSVSTSTAPVLSGSGWHRELTTMTVLGAEVMLPLLFVGVLHAIARQDPGGLARTAFIRVPLALLLTAAGVELVSLGLQATDQACASLLHSAGRPLLGLFGHMDTALSSSSAGALGGGFIFLVVAGALSFLVWLELAVRSAAVAVAVLFLPLALAGSALPATAHWGRRLAETITALVLSKLAIVAVLSLAVSALGSGGGNFSALTEGIALLALAAAAPLALAKMLPMVEAGAISHLEGLGRRSVQGAVSLAGGAESWFATTAAGARPPGSSSSPPGGATVAGARPVGGRRSASPSAEAMPPPPPAAPVA